MISLILINDGTGTNESANYRWEVAVNGRVLEVGRITGHNRDDGWRALIRLFATKAGEGEPDDGAQVVH